MPVRKKKSSLICLYKTDNYACIETLTILNEKNIDTPVQEARMQTCTKTKYRYGCTKENH